jgi:hypothetical protein
LPLAPLSLPYSPEFEPRPDAAEGRRTLSEMARASGGVERTAWDDVFNSARLRDRQIRDLVIPLAGLLLLIHVIEIGGRRLLLFAAASAWLRSVRLPALPRPWRTRQPASPMPVPVEQGARAEAATLPERQPAPPAAPRESPLARAKARARDRLGD